MGLRKNTGMQEHSKSARGLALGFIIPAMTLFNLRQRLQSKLAPLTEPLVALMRSASRYVPIEGALLLK